MKRQSSNFAVWILSLVGMMTGLTGGVGPLAQGATKQWIVRDGQPQATIVIAESPPRMTKLAATELQSFIEKISGARLPISTAPQPELPVTIYVGQSSYTDQLKISSEGLDDGAFRMVSGDHWLALVGRDTDFVPPEPWAKHNGDIPRATAEWDKLTGSTWGNAVSDELYREYNSEKKLWAFDERGSLNAVYEFLREQGVRWYMPGDLGQITPKKATIPIPVVDAVTRPAFGLRYHTFGLFAGAQWEDILWYLRLGLNKSSKDVGFPFVQSHGMQAVICRPEMQKAHPEYYAVWGGKRMNQDIGKPCLSSEGLFQENVRLIRAMFDIYDVPMASVFPPDGFALMCECDLCKGKGTPERGRDGSMSDYVWAYANRVAQEVYKTHPNKKISCFAYGAYMLPPLKIEKFSPNLVVGILEPRREFGDQAERKQFLDMRQAWMAKSSSENKILIWQHYPFTAPGRPSAGVPHYFPHAVAQDLHSLKGISYGELLELTFDPQRIFGIHGPAFSHLNVYVTAQMYWNPDQDVDALLTEYYRDFYGPAAAEMKAFVEFCEANMKSLYKSADTINKVFSLVAAAQQKAGPPGDGAVYRKRIDLLVEYLQPLKALAAKFAKGRKDMPIARASTVSVAPAAIKIDGQLDEEEWKNLQNYDLSELIAAGKPAAATSFKMFWAGDSLFLAIHCDDPDTKHLNIGTTKNGDQALWNGDALEILIETQTHSYYQIAINPVGAQVNVDRISGLNFDWSSQAQVATHIGDGFWTAEVRIPVDSSGGQIDPLHNVVGVKPTEAHPWYFNICRQRLRDNGSEFSAYSPTGEKNFHETSRFARLSAP